MGSKFLNDFPETFKKKLNLVGDRLPFEYEPGEIPEDFRRAAVLLPFWREEETIRMVAFVRSSTAPTHAGQVAFPGGAAEPSDGSLVETALRESEEELGIVPDRVSILGQLDDAWSGGKFHVSSFVGWLDEPPDIRPDKREVERAVIAEVEPLFDPEALISHPITRFGRTWTSHSFELPGARLYGFSADLFMEVQDYMRGEDLGRGAKRLEELRRWIGAGMPPWVPAKTSEDEG